MSKLTILRNDKFLLVCIPFLTTLIFFSEQIFGDAYFWSTYWSDYSELVTPFFYFNAKALSLGELPLWNPYCYGGLPHISESVVGFFYPFHYLGYFLVGKGFMSPFTWISFTLIFHFWLIQVGTAWLLKHLKIPILGALLGAVAFAFCSKTVFNHNYLSFIINFAWFPLSLLFLIKLLKTPALKYSVFLAFSVAMMFLGGNPNILFFSIIFFLVYAVVVAVVERKTILVGITKTLVFLAISMIIALLLCAPQLIETMGFLEYSERDAIDITFASDGSLQWRQLSTVISPKLFGYFSEGSEDMAYWATPGRVYHSWETAFYFGISTFILGLIGIYNNYKKPIVIVSLILAVFGLFYSLGTNSFLFEFLFNSVPGFDKFRIPSRALFFTSFAFVVFAGFGFKSLFDEKLDKQKKIIPFLISLGLLGIAYISYEPIVQFETMAGKYLSVSAGFITLSAILIAIVIFTKNKYNLLLGAMLIALVFMDLSYWNKSYKNGKTDPNKVYFGDKTQLSYLYPASNNEFFRVADKTSKYRLLRRNQSIFMDINSFTGLYSLRKAHKVPRSFPVRDLYAVKYFITPTVSNGNYTGQFQIEENPNFIPYARMMYQTEKFQLMPDSLSDYPLKSKIIVENDFDLPIANKAMGEVEHSVNIVEKTFNTRKIEVSTQEPGILSLGEFFYPAWNVKLNDEKVDLLKVNFTMQGVYVPSGNHVITLRYMNPLFMPSLILFGLSLLIIVVFSSFVLYKKWITVK